MSKITKEEMLEFIDEVKNGWDWQPEENKIFDAIRRLIEKVAEWRERTQNIRIEIKNNRFLSWESDLQEFEAMRIIAEIRDFIKDK